MLQIENFISASNMSLYDILVNESVFGRSILKSAFGISTGNKSERQLRSKLLNKSSKLLSKLSDYHFEIREMSKPLYTGYYSFESFTSEFDLHVIGVDDGYFLLSYSTNEDVQIKMFDDLEDCINSCSRFLKNHLNYLEVELSNYEENKEYYDDSESNGLGLSMELEWNFPLPDYLYENRVISEARLFEINAILQRILSFK